MSKPTYEELQQDYNDTKATAEAAYGKVGINELAAAQMAHEVAKLAYKRKLTQMLMS